MAKDDGGATVVTPFQDDPQPNFAFFAYDGIPEWKASARPGAASVTYSSETLSTLPVYHLITTESRMRSLSTFLVLVQVPTGVQIINGRAHWSTMARSMTISDIAPVEVFGVMLWARTCGN